MADCVLIVSVTFVRLVKASSYLGLTATPSLQQGVGQGKTPPSEIPSLPGAPWAVPIQQPGGRPGGQPGGRKPTGMQVPAVGLPLPPVVPHAWPAVSVQGELVRSECLEGLTAGRDPV